MLRKCPDCDEELDEDGTCPVCGEIYASEDVKEDETSEETEEEY